MNEIERRTRKAAKEWIGIHVARSQLVDRMNEEERDEVYALCTKAWEDAVAATMREVMAGLDLKNAG